MARTQTTTTRRLWRPGAKEQALLHKALAQPLVQLGLFIGYVIALVAVMTAGFKVHEASLTSAQIGQIAPREIKATREFTFEEPDPEATALRRAEAAARVAPVYDWHEDRQEQTRDQVQRAFIQLRRALAARAPHDPSVPQPAAAEEPDSVKIARLDPAQRVRLARELRQEHFDAHFPVRLSDEDFELLALEGYSTRQELALVSLIDEALGRMVVTSTQPIEEHPRRGLTLRRIRQGVVLVEYQLRDVLDRLVVMEELPELLRSSARAQMSEPSERAARQLMMGIALRLIKPNTEHHELLTQERRAAASLAVPEVVRQELVRKGHVILDRGQRIEARHVQLYQVMIASGQELERAQILLGLLLMALLVIVSVSLFGRHNLPHFALKPKDVAFLATTLLLFVAAARLGKALSYAASPQLPVDAVQLGLPMAAAAMLVRLMLRTEHAVVFSVVLSVLVGLILDQAMMAGIYTLLGSLMGVAYVRQIKRRMALMTAGLVVGLMNALMVTALLLLRGELLQVQALYHVLLALLGGLTCGSLVLAGLPVFEWAFRYTTDIKLLELSNMNHPLLRELILRAPGSYHHSMMVGSLCEAAAEAIGCNSLLARVGAYYHDVGKAKNPGYFAENQRYGENPHDRLKPNMSALIIKAHVKDGVEMARQHGLPQEIIDFIAQHHGTSLIAYFYHKAKQLETPDIPEVNEKDYRYPGPKPQTRETAICLLADGIEAASRAMKNPSPAKLRGLVQTMINRAFTDGQLDECDLTFKDLNLISQSFLRILTGIYHHRPEYPDQKPSAASSPAQASQASQASPTSQAPPQAPDPSSRKRSTA